jgi:hypothetical protein
MRRHRRRELFPADRGLQVRMVAVSVLTPALVLALLALCVAELPLKVLIAMAVVIVISLGAAVGGRDDQPEFDLLEPGELEAVVAHELSHVAHRDATVMTVVGGPGAVLLEGGRTNLGWWGPLVAARLFSFAIGLLASIGSHTLSRYRELTADAGAAALTGRPSALASALLKVSGALELVPRTDLRAVAARDGLHLLAVDDANGWRRLLGRTHPSVERRIAALERLEHRAAHARHAPPS